MTNKTGILFFILLPCCIMQLYSQDPVFSHFYANGIQMNPSLAGIEGHTKVYVGYRNQWPGSGASFVTYQASYDQFIDKIQGGLGVKLMNDRQAGGIINAYNLDLMYSYQFNATRKLSFSGGIQGGLGQRSFEPGLLTFGDMIDPVTGELSSFTLEQEIGGYKKIYPDFAAGASVFYRNIYGGLAMHHLFSPLTSDGNEDYEKLARKYTAHIGALIPIFENRRHTELMKLSPNLVFIQQGPIQQINYGLDMIYQDFLLGLWTRHDFLLHYGNIIFNVGYSTPSIRFRYSYDVKLSRPTIQLPNMGAHEISLLIIYENLSKRNKLRTIKCPKI